MYMHLVRFDSAAAGDDAMSVRTNAGSAVRYLFDEIVASAEQRSTTAQRMPQSVIDAICVRG
jgi:hypothetical protein